MIDSTLNAIRNLVGSAATLSGAAQARLSAWYARKSRQARPGPLLVVAFGGDGPSRVLLVHYDAKTNRRCVPASPFPRFHIAEMVDEIGLADLRLLRAAFSPVEVREALRAATGIANVDIVLGERQDIDALLSGVLSSRQIRRTIRARRFTTSLTARELHRNFT